MIFNGLAILACLTIGTVSLHTESWPVPKIVFVAISFGLIAADAVWLNYFAWKNPRFLAYGPAEYIRESELAHELKMTVRQNS
jgi:hypothetical protein